MLRAAFVGEIYTYFFLQPACRAMQIRRRWRCRATVAITLSLSLSGPSRAWWGSASLCRNPVSPSLYIFTLHRTWQYGSFAHGPLPPPFRFRRVLLQNRLQFCLHVHLIFQFVPSLLSRFKFRRFIYQTGAPRLFLQLPFLIFVIFIMCCVFFFFRFLIFSVFAEGRGDRGWTERDAHERVRRAVGTRHQAAGVIRVQPHPLSGATPSPRVDWSRFGLPLSDWSRFVSPRCDGRYLVGDL